MINVLCLHGLRHNKEELKKSMKDMIKKTKNLVIFEFVDAPFDFPDEPLFKQWWTATKSNALTIEHYDTINESFTYLLKIWNSKHYHGLLGFSQGSVMIQLFYYFIHQNTNLVIHLPKFLIFCSTSLISDINLRSFYNNKITIPSAFLYGLNDPLIDSSSIFDIASTISTNPYYIKHDGGHYVSSKKDVIIKLLDFITSIPFI